MRWAKYSWMVMVLVVVVEASLLSSVAGLPSAWVGREKVVSATAARTHVELRKGAVIRREPESRLPVFPPSPLRGPDCRVQGKAAAHPLAESQVRQ